nr:hypothetical protein [Tanacetum cinerariifolium]
DPEFAKQNVQRALVEVVRAVRESQHGDDLQERRRNGQHVGVERGESEALERQRQIALDGRRGDVCNQADEVETPHSRVFPRLP